MGLNKCGTSVEPISYEWELTLKDSIKIETVKTDSFSMDYFKFGHGKDTFVILPGVSLLSVMNFADAVADAYKVLADDYTIYVFERKNEITSSYSIVEMAENTSEAFKCLGLDKVTLRSKGQPAGYIKDRFIGISEQFFGYFDLTLTDIITYRNTDLFIELARQIA